MYCNNCGGFVQDGSPNCPNCGAMIGAPAVNQMGYGQQSMGYSQPPVGAYGGPQPAQGMAIASLILGILPFCICWFGDGIGLCIGIIASIVGIVLGAVARKQGNRSGIATAGFVVSIVALSLVVLLFIIAAIIVAPVYRYKFF